jgi:hypothetical protein
MLIIPILTIHISKEKRILKHLGTSMNLTNNSYSPAKPYAATCHANMSQDVITTKLIVVDSISTTPVATFQKAGGNHVEALVVASPGQGGRTVCHVMKDLSSDAGWRVLPLAGASDPTEVAAGVANSTVYGFFLNQTGLHSLKTDGTTWTNPQSIKLPEGVVCSNIRVAYSQFGRLILYGQTAQGDLVTAVQKVANGEFESSVCAMDATLANGDFFLCMTTESAWELAANVKGAAWLFTGELENNEYSSKQQVTALAQPLKEVVLGYYNPVENTQLFLFVDNEDTLHVCSPGDDGHKVKPVPNSKVSRAIGHVNSNDQDSLLHVYGASADKSLWVLHQSPTKPWNDDGSPNWAPIIPLGKGVADLFGDINPATAPSIFAIDDQGALKLHVQDPVTSMWKGGYVHQAAAEAFEVVRFRAEVNLRDANGLPLKGEKVTVSLAENTSATQIAVGAQLYSITASTPAQLNTDLSGKISLAILANAGMACGDLILQSPELPSPITISPSSAVHKYLSGEGTLNPTNPGGPLPEFDENGDTLRNAKTANGTPLAPGAASNPGLSATAAQAVRNTAQIHGNNLTARLSGYTANFDPAKPSFREVTSPQELATLMQEQPLTGFWDDLKHFFGDIWEGIKNAAIKIKDFIVDAATKIAKFTLELIDGIKHAVELLVKGIEEVAHFIAGVFHAIEAAIEKVIDWLKALFDFGAIWRTKMAFQEGLMLMPPYVKKMVTLGEKAADNWFSKQKATVDQAFAALKKHYADQPFSSLQGWQSPQQGPSSEPSANGASAADFTQNVHHNWLMEKVVSNPPPDHAVRSGLAAMAAMDDPFAGFEAHVAASKKEFEDAIKDFGEALKAVFDPHSSNNFIISKLLDMVNKVIDALLDFLDAIVDAIMEVAAVAMDVVDKILNTELNLGFLNTLWAWVASCAGYPNDSKLTMSALVCLLGAFPSTIIFKLVCGVHHEPFPDGKFPLAKKTTALGIEMPWQCKITSDVLQILQVIPAMAGDYMGNKIPGWLTALGLAWSAVVWGLANGYPDLTAVEWLGAATVVGFLLELAPTFQMILDSWTLWQTNRSDILDVLISVYGIGKLILGIISDATFGANNPAGHKIAAILLPLSPAFGFLNMDYFRNSEAAPVAIFTNFFFDFIAYVLGGLELLIDDLSLIPKKAEGVTA